MAGSNAMKNVTIIDHPLAHHSITILRDKGTLTQEFRHHAAIVSKIVAIAATKELKLTDKKIATPLSPMTGRKLKDEIVLVPVLRAGLAMLFALQDFLPGAAVGFIGLERDEKTAIAREYYQKLPKLLKTHTVMVLDPMLATGGSFDDTVSVLKKKGAKHIILVCIVAAPEGLERLAKEYPQIVIYTAAIDRRLNGKKYIVPGLGDFGDRYFGTR